MPERRRRVVVEGGGVGNTAVTNLKLRMKRHHCNECKSNIRHRFHKRHKRIAMKSSNVNFRSATILCAARIVVHVAITRRLSRFARQRRKRHRRNFISAKLIHKRQTARSNKQVQRKREGQYRAEKVHTRRDGKKLEMLQAHCLFTVLTRPVSPPESVCRHPKQS
jgi:hypothetical protein